MHLSITTTHQPATDLGFLLHKHPDKIQSVDLSVGKAHILYPESSHDRSTISVVLDIDPIAYFRSTRRSNVGFALDQYVNDRPYVLSSFMSVALTHAFSTAMGGRCASHPELASKPIPLIVTLDVVAAPRGGEELIRSLFEPLGYVVDVSSYQLNDQFPQWGNGKYYSVTLSNVCTVQSLLTHLYVLIPALDSNRHYFISQEEVNVLLRKVDGWLPTHPKRELIARRFLLHLKGLSNDAIDRLRLLDSEIEPEDAPPSDESNSQEQKQRISLHDTRLAAVVDELLAHNISSVADLGCGEGKLLRLLLKHPQFTKIIGVDVSFDALRKAKDRLHWDEISEKTKQRIDIFQSSVTYVDKRLAGVDAAVLVEVIEHVDESRLGSLESAVFGHIKANLVIITTPNSDYNVVYTTLQDGDLRHDDHRFEWSRNQFEAWCKRVAETYGYSFTCKPLGDPHPEHGAPSQMGVFQRGY